MPERGLTGSRIRDRRLQLALKQSDLAKEVGISASYLNLIEHNRRRIGGRLLIDLARALKTEPLTLAEGAEAAVMVGLRDAAQGEDGVELDRLQEFAGRFPGWADLVIAQHRRLTDLERANAALSDRLAHDPELSAALHEVISAVTAIRSTASILVETEDLEADWTRRFHRNLADDSGRLSTGASALVAYLDAVDSEGVEAGNPQEEIEAFLDARGWHLPELERALSTDPDTVLTQADPPLSPDALTLGAEVLGRYARDAARMPLTDFINSAEQLSFDPVALADRFGVGISEVLRRLAHIPADRLPAPFGLVVADGAGALTLRKGLDGFALPRFGAGCPLWPLYRAISRPMTPLRAVLDVGARAGGRLLAYAICQPRRPGGFDDAEVIEAVMLLIPEGVVRFPDTPPEPVGLACRVCARQDCAARREPSVLQTEF